MQNGVFFPEGTKILGRDMKTNALVGVAGKGGAGKSHLIHQLLTDPDYGPDEVGILMAEDATSTYRCEGAHIYRFTNLASLDDVISAIKIASKEGKRLPKAWAVDSLSGTMDYQRRSYKNNPIVSEKTGGRDKREEYGEMGYMGMDSLIDLRDSVNSDVLVLVTTHEAKGSLPEFALAGQLLPKNFVRLTNVALHLRSEVGSYDKGQQVKPHPWRTISRHGIYIDRFFYTQDSGEFLGKGHTNLDIKEQAYLPDVLRKIHGEKPLFIE